MKIFSLRDIAENNLSFRRKLTKEEQIDYREKAITPAL